MPTNAAHMNLFRWFNGLINGEVVHTITGG